MTELLGIFYDALTNVGKDRISSILSLLTSIIILAASYFQWWDLTYDGTMITRKWVKFLFAVLILLLLLATLLLFL